MVEYPAIANVAPPSYTEGAHNPLSTDLTGSLRVNITGGAGSGGTSSVDEAGFTAGVSSGTPAMGVVNPSDTPPNGDLAIVALDAARNEKVNIAAGFGSSALTPSFATVTGTVTTTPPANASTNVAQLAGTTTSVNSGNKDAGTLRVVIATDQPQLTNKLLVTPDSVALPANQSVNVAQVNGQTTAANAGISGVGTLRVVQATANVCNITQVSVPTTAGGIIVIAANANRIKLRVTNTTTNPVWITTNSTPTTGNGDYIPGIAGYPWISRFEGALYAISTGGTALVTVYEESST